jgi:hypothetical protein
MKYFIVRLDGHEQEVTKKQYYTELWEWGILQSIFILTIGLMLLGLMSMFYV